MRRMGVARSQQRRESEWRSASRPGLCVHCVAQVRSAARSAFATICGGPAPASPQGQLGARVRFFRTSPILA
jgi:hypothetical protein